MNAKAEVTTRSDEDRARDWVVLRCLGRIVLSVTIQDDGR